MFQQLSSFLNDMHWEIEGWRSVAFQVLAKKLLNQRPRYFDGKEGALP